LGQKYGGDFAKARDRLFSEIHRCGVSGAEEDDIADWLDDTVQFLSEEYPALSIADRDSLKQAGRNFLAPVIPHGVGKDATNRDEWDGEAAEDAVAGDDEAEAAAND
jgi:hypothetical protein